MVPTYQSNNQARIPTIFFLIRCAIQSTAKLCVAHGKFINVEVKWPGNVHDARVFANCDMQNNYSSGKFNLFYKEILPGYDCIPQLLLADLAYPLLPYVMKEYEHCSTNEEGQNKGRGEISPLLNMYTER